MVYMWAPGAMPLMVPQNVGIPMDGPGGYRRFILQVHYDNPKGDSGVVDGSGIEVHYTTNVREHDMGIFQVGDPFVRAQPRVLTELGGLTEHEFVCPSSCTQLYFRQDVTVFSEYLHMHQKGKMARTDQIRGGRSIRSGVSEYFEFDQQGGVAVVQEPFSVLPGDSFRTICSFDAKPGEHGEIHRAKIVELIDIHEAE